MSHIFVFSCFVLNRYLFLNKCLDDCLTMNGKLGEVARDYGSQREPEVRNERTMTSYASSWLSCRRETEKVKIR